MKKIWILFGTLAALTVAVLASATCPLPTGSAGGNGWNGGATQGYFTRVRLATGGTKILATWCPIPSGFCQETVAADFGGKAIFTYAGGEWNGSAAYPLRFIGFKKTGCGPSSDRWCITFAGDVNVGGHINPLQNATEWRMDPTLAQPTTITDPTYYESPRWFVKIAGVGATVPNTLRISRVNSTNTGISNSDIFFGPMSCP